jgi:hypothetical protein
VGAPDDRPPLDPSGGRSGPHTGERIPSRRPPKGAEAGSTAAERSQNKRTPWAVGQRIAATTRTEDQLLADYLATLDRAAFPAVVFFSGRAFPSGQPAAGLGWATRGRS